MIIMDALNKDFYHRLISVLMYPAYANIYKDSSPKYGSPTGSK